MTACFASASENREGSERVGRGKRCRIGFGIQGEVMMVGEDTGSAGDG